MDKCALDIQGTLEAFNLPFKFSNLTIGDGNCFAYAIIDQIQLPEHWDSILPRAQIRDYREFKRKIVQFIRTDAQLQQDQNFQLAKESMTYEDLRQIQKDKYGHLTQDQAFEKFLDQYANMDYVYAENVIVFATPYFLGKPLYTTQRFYSHSEDITMEQQIENWKIQDRWQKFGFDIETDANSLKNCPQCDGLKSIKYW